MTDLLTIAETRRALNVSATTLWRWEQIGLSKHASPLTVCKGHAVENGDLFGGGE